MANQLCIPNVEFYPRITGSCPRYLFRSGDTFSHLPVKTLVNASVNTLQNVVVSDRVNDTTQIFRPAREPYDVVKARLKEATVYYRHPTNPGIEDTIYNRRYMIQATEAMSKAERMEYRNLQAVNQTSRLGKRKTRKVDFPLVVVRPEKVAFQRTIAVNVEAPMPPPSLDTYHKQIRVGFTAKPRGQECGSLMLLSRVPRKRALVPQNVMHMDPPLTLGNNIYHRHLDMTQSYGGHIPGQKFKLTTDTHDALRWLRGDFALR